MRSGIDGLDGYTTWTLNDSGQAAILATAPVVSYRVLFHDGQTLTTVASKGMQVPGRAETFQGFSAARAQQRGRHRVRGVCQPGWSGRVQRVVCSNRGRGGDDRARGWRVRRPRPAEEISATSAVPLLTTPARSHSTRASRTADPAFIEPTPPAMPCSSRGPIRRYRAAARWARSPRRWATSPIRSRAATGPCRPPSRPAGRSHSWRMPRAPWSRRRVSTSATIARSSTSRVGATRSTAAS
jgi:hypothetical protein